MEDLSSISSTMDFMMSRSAKQIQLICALREYERDNKNFTIGDIVAKTGYNENSVRKYINEKLNGVHLHQIDEKLWRAEGVLKLSDDEFCQLMSQSLKAKALTPDLRLSRSLMKRSLDAFTLALEVYNRPSLENRVEAFCIFSVNAWELMLKATLIKTSGSDAVFQKNRRSISITDAVNKTLQQNDPIRKNIEALIELRDSAIHLLIPELQPQLSRLFQANVLNYQQRYTLEMGCSPLSGQSVGMLSLVVDGANSEIALIKENYGEMTADAVAEFLDKFNKTAAEANSFEFSIPMDYRLTLSRSKKSSDLVLSTGDNGQKAIIIRETKDPDTTHPHYRTAAISLLNSKQDITISTYSFNAVIKKHGIQKDRKSEMHYEIDGRHRYSDNFIKWFISNLSQPNWLNDAVTSYKRK